VLGDAWWNEKAGAYWGLAAGDYDLVKIQFWIDNHGGRHPDARLEPDEPLAPGQTYRPASPAAVLCVAGRGDRFAWQTQARAVLDSLRLELPLPDGRRVSAMIEKGADYSSLLPLEPIRKP
jgi:hypothetical protein